MTTVVNSHLHIDHVGGNQLFKGTGVKHVLHEKELAQGRNHEPFEFFGYSDKSWDYEGADFAPVSGDVELAKGLWLYETPGHTVGHYSVLAASEGVEAAAVRDGRRVHGGRAGEGDPARLPQRPVRRRALDRAREGARRGARRRRSSSRTTWRRGRRTGTRPDFYEL